MWHFLGSAFGVDCWSTRLHHRVPNVGSNLKREQKKLQLFLRTIVRTN